MTISIALRRDLRSMYGVFHQMYVLRRVVEWYRRLESRSMLRRAQNLTENCEHFMHAYGIVKKHADLTAAGCAMVQSIQPAIAKTRRA
jgi:RecB family endonuclease NucS